MTLKEIYAKLQTLNIPVAYDHFETPQIPPFCIYITSDNLSGADYKNMLRRRAVRIEFYSTIKDEDSETAIEKLFNEYEMSKSIFNKFNTVSINKPPP